MTFVIIRILSHLNILIGKLKFRYFYCYLQFLYKERVDIPEKRFFDGEIILDLDDSNSTITIGKNGNFRNYCRILCHQNGQVSIDSNVYFNYSCSVNCFGEISIGENSIFGENVKIYDHNHTFSNKDILIKDQDFNVSNVKIGKNCWVGSNTIILMGVEIGDNVVIGANNLIFKSIPSNTVVKANITNTIEKL